MTSRELLESISVIVAADGKLAVEEKQYLYDVAKKFRVSKKELNDIFDKVRLGKGIISTPHSKEDQIELYDHLMAAAVADGDISQEEEAILDRLIEKFGIRKRSGNDIGALSRPDSLGPGAEVYVVPPNPVSVAPNRSQSTSQSGNSVWAIAVVLLFIVAIAAFLFYHYVPSVRGGYSDVKGAIKTVYSDGKMLGSNALEKNKTIIVHSVIEHFSRDPKLIVESARVSVTLKGSSTGIIFTAGATLTVQDIRVQYYIPLAELTDQDFVVQGSELLINIPRPRLDDDLIDVPHPDKWIVSQKSLFGSGTVLEELKEKVRDEAIVRASATDGDSYREALEDGDRVVKDLMLPIVRAIVPDVTIRVQYREQL